MIEHPVEAGSDAWRKLRMGIPTASSFDKIITPAKAELSASSRTYAYKLICERLLNAPTDTLDGIEWIEHGKAMEPFAIKQYEFVTDVATRPCGFFTTNDGLIGATPDRVIVGQPAGVEIKSPAPWTQLGYLLDGPGNAYRPQIQGQLFVCEFEWADLYGFHVRMPAARIRTVRDEPYIAKLRAALALFTEQLAEMTDRAQKLGVFQAYDAAVSVTDIDRAAQLAKELDPRLDPALREA